MKYALRRAPGWILCPCSPNGARWPDTTADPTQAWISADLDEAIERQSLLRLAFGIATEVRAMPADCSPLSTAP